MKTSRWLPLALIRRAGFALLGRRRVDEPQAGSRRAALAADRQTGTEFACRCCTTRTHGDGWPTCAASRTCSTSGAAGAWNAGSNTRCSPASPRPSACASIGYNWKDEPADALRWLEQFGNPYWWCWPMWKAARDRLGHLRRAGNLPGRRCNGIVRWKHVGPLTDAVIADELMPALQQVEAAR
jgi:hypothetical protein